MCLYHREKTRTGAEEAGHSTEASNPAEIKKDFKSALIIMPPEETWEQMQKIRMYVYIYYEVRKTFQLIWCLTHKMLVIYI